MTNKLNNTELDLFATILKNTGKPDHAAAYRELIAYREAESHPVAWMAKREGHPNFCIVQRLESSIDEWIPDYEINPPVTKHPLYESPVLGGSKYVPVNWQPDNNLLSNLYHWRDCAKLTSDQASVLHVSHLNSIIRALENAKIRITELKTSSVLKHHPELIQTLRTMTRLCRLKYGNLDKDVYAEIEKAEAAIANATGESE